jgi:hypothetical protein
MNAMKIIFWVVTGLLCLMMLGSAGMYIFNYGSTAAIFQSLGYPTYIIYPLAIAKILGVIAIVSNFSKPLKEWAYAGFFYDFLLAASAHYFSGIPSPMLAIVALALLIVSYILDKKVRG